MKTRETDVPAALFPPNQIDGLIRLLLDDDPKIFDEVREHLAASMEVARPMLLEHSRNHGDPRVRQEAGAFLIEYSREEVLEEWETLVEGEAEPDLEKGAFLIARQENPTLDIAPFRKILDDCAAVLERRLPPSREAPVVIAKLNRLLFREMALQGNREDPADPDNSYLPRILERKLGNTTSLSVVAILVARRIGFELEGVGLPGHFLLRYRHGKKELYFDPFNAGRAWTLKDCLHYLKSEGYDFHEQYLRTYSSRKILTRMLARLLNIFRQREDEARVDRISAMLQCLHE